MAKYNVVFAVSYPVEAEDEKDAESKATDLFVEELGNPNLSSLLDIFGCNVEDDK